MRMSSIEIKFWEEKAIDACIEAHEYCEGGKFNGDDVDLLVNIGFVGEKLKEIRDAKAKRKE